jgi:hypothetical protein
MPDAWDTYIHRQQSQGPTTSSPGMANPFEGVPFFRNIWGALGLDGGSGGSGPGALKPNKQGLYSPSMMPMPVGPPTPINYGAIRSLLNSGAMRTGQVNAPQPMPAPVEEPAPAQKPKSPLASLLSLFSGIGG